MSDAPEEKTITPDSQTWSQFVERYNAELRERSGSVPAAAPNCVTIFGAGVAGLTAAHELVERGFRVQVWDPVFDERDPSRGCDIGGMARTQWSRVPWGEGADAGVHDPISEEWKNRQTTRILHLPWVFYTSGDARDHEILGAVGEYTAYFRKSTTGGNDQSDKDQLAKLVKEMANALFRDEYPFGRSIYCEVQRLTPSHENGRDRAEAVAKRLANLYDTGELKIEILPQSQSNANSPYAEHLIAEAKLDGKTVRFHIALVDDFPDGLPVGVGERISFRVRERWIPGEHGFRFFPAFYRHIFDTMRRTPILEAAPKSTLAAAQERAVTVDPNPDKYVETGRTVFDNLHPTTKQIISLAGGIGPSVLSRSLPKSFEELREWTRLILQSPPPTPEETELEGSAENKGPKKKGGFGFNVRDLALFQLKFLQYMTSCDARRKEYEHITWAEYLGGNDAYSAEFIQILNSIPQALVAMNAMVSDTRTQASIFAQLLLDNIKPDGYRDGTLVGPTSVAWLTPWRRYLEAQGVEFIHGKITGFKQMKPPASTSHTEPEEILWPEVECYEPRYLGALEHKVALMPGYFLLALPAQELCSVAKDFQAKSQKTLIEGSDIKRAASYFSEVDDIEKLLTPKPTGALRHMVGIQYYFDEDVYWRDGHFYLPLSRWGISAVSQVRFWQDKHDWEHGYRGVLSVVFTVPEYDGPTEPNDKRPTSLWTLERHQVAEEIWDEIQRCIGDQHLPNPRYFHMDFGFRRDAKTDKHADRYLNMTPMLINIPGRWDNRPGDLFEIGDNSLENDYRDRVIESKYKVEQGVVLAGTLMKTFTRLTTMEAANESGRHAVNAILQDAQGRARLAQKGKEDPAIANKQLLRYSPCDVWPPELFEIDDLRFLKEVDAELHARGLDHFLEILDLQETIRTFMRGSRKHTRDPFDPLAVLGQLDRVLTSLRGGFINVIREHKVTR